MQLYSMEEKGRAEKERRKLGRSEVPKVRRLEKVGWEKKKVGRKKERSKG